MSGSAALTSAMRLAGEAVAAYPTPEVAAPARVFPYNLTERLFLPFVPKQLAAGSASIFGVTVEPLTPEGGLAEAVGLGATWTRESGVLWSEVEAVEGQRDWSKLALYEQQLLNGARNNIRVITIISLAPSWAQLVPGVLCGPIKPEKIQAFADFVGAVVAKYSQPPYNAKHWEIWNEPDAPIGSGPNDALYGCWGDPADPYYGGGYYADMLKSVYPKIKQADPNAKVLVGGLLLDCDPATPPPGKTCADARFFEGMLRNGAAEVFDAVSFHAYDGIIVAPGGTPRYGNENWGSRWDTTGPVGVKKAKFLRAVMEQYGVTGKSLINTESAVICYGCEQPFPADVQPLWDEVKSGYVAEAYAAALADGLEANLWYSLRGWFGSELTRRNLSPTPAYYAYGLTALKLTGAQFVTYTTEADVGVSGARGYVFARNNREIWLVAPTVEHTQTLKLPAPPTAIFDVRGQPLPADTSVTLGHLPIFIEFQSSPRRP